MSSSTMSRHGGHEPRNLGGDDAERVRALETEVAQLRTAMASRAVIEQAKGVLMLLTGCGDERAFDLLTHISSHTHRKVRDIAQELVSMIETQRAYSSNAKIVQTADEMMEEVTRLKR